VGLTNGLASSFGLVKSGAEHNYHRSSSAILNDILKLIGSHRIYMRENCFSKLISQSAVAIGSMLQKEKMFLEWMKCSFVSKVGVLHCPFFTK